MSDTTQLPNVAIVGRPNVGKSALFNRLAGRKIAIVHDQPGITRDRLSATCTCSERPFTLWDTGGIVGAGESELTQEVQHVAENALRESDLLLFVVDGKEGLSPVDGDLARMLRRSHKPVVLVINKIDNEKQDPLAAEFESLGFETLIPVSAEHNRGISELLDAIERLLPLPAGDSRCTIHDSLSIAIIGRPNVGKSSLINSIVRGEHAIVSELPGTTRDAIDIAYERDGRQFVFIDTAGIRRRGKVSSSAEVFSVMRAERGIRRADLSILVIDLTMGVTAQDKRIAGLIQKARKPAMIVLNKWDQVKPRRGEKQTVARIIEETHTRVFFLEYAPVVVTSALTGENIDNIFASIRKIERTARKRIGTGVLNRLLRHAFAANPPPIVKGRRLKIFYATQTASHNLSAADRHANECVPARKTPPSDLTTPEFVLFVNDPRLLNETYRRYLESRLRKAEPYPGLPINFLLR